jgi:hypothetical protein
LHNIGISEGQVGLLPESGDQRGFAALALAQPLPGQPVQLRLRPGASGNNNKLFAARTDESVDGGTGADEGRINGIGENGFDGGRAGIERTPFNGDPNLLFKVPLGDRVKSLSMGDVRKTTQPEWPPFSSPRAPNAAKPRNNKRVVVRVRFTIFGEVKRGSISTSGACLTTSASGESKPRTAALQIKSRERR